MQLQPGGGGTATISTTYSYDALDRLTGETVTSSLTGQSFSDMYSYDLDGNRLSDVHTGPGDGASGTTTYIYNSNDELTSQTSSVSGLTTFTYDANGSQLTSTNGTNVTTYSYNLRGKMVAYAVNGVVQATYVYDDAGNRVQETTGGVTSYYLIDTNNPTGYAEPIEVRASMSSLPVMTYLIGNDVYGQVASGTTNPTYYLTDGHGSTRATVSSTGAVTATFNYDVFGGAIGFTPSASTPIFLFGGDAVYDYVSGLYMHGDGERDRQGFEFIQMDPTSGDNSDPLSLHKYLYADADPINGFDPSGDDDDIGDLLDFSDIDDVLTSTTQPATTQATTQASGAVGGMLPLWLVDRDGGVPNGNEGGHIDLVIPWLLNGGGNKEWLVGYYDKVPAGLNDEQEFQAARNGIPGVVNFTWWQWHDSRPKYIEGPPNGELSRMTEVLISTNQAQIIDTAITNLRSNPGTYFLLTNNCAEVAGKILASANVLGATSFFVLPNALLVSVANANNTPITLGYTEWDQSAGVQIVRT
jgi:YD repeat-containing protein